MEKVVIVVCRDYRDFVQVFMKQSPKLNTGYCYENQFYEWG